MADTLIYKKKSRILGILCTFFVTGCILLILLLIILHTPIPPFPEGGGGAGNGIELNLGFSDAGMGNNQQELAPSSETTPQLVVKTAPEEVLTQDMEDAPSLNEKKEPKKIKKEVKPVTEKVKVVKKEPEKPKQVVNTKALYRAKNSQTSSDGDQHTSGDQGKPNGNLGATAFGGNGGSNGSGGGTGGGNGTGTGKGTGNGVSYNLKDRIPQSLPMPEYKQQVEGIVVVEVTVDKEGKVTQAEPGKRGTTTTDDNLWEAAKRAALQAKFDRKPDAPAFQKGTITYRFRLQ
jgi:TonB family protein